MRIEVVGRGIEATDAIREYAEKKAHKLERFLDMIQQITVTIDKPTASKEIYQVECVVDVEHHADFVGKAEHNDIYAGIDLVTDKCARQLTDHKEKLKLGHR